MKSMKPLNEDSSAISKSTTRDKNKSCTKVKPSSNRQSNSRSNRKKKNIPKKGNNSRNVLSDVAVERDFALTAMIRSM